MDYETGRAESAGFRPRGSSYEARAAVVSSARQAAGARKDVRFGQILSGSKLVDDPVFRANLKARYPDAIGGEMEGIGLVSACERHGTPWLLAKAICDWGFGKTSDAQADAARRSVEFCLDFLLS